MFKIGKRALALILSAALCFGFAQLPQVSATESEPVQMEYLDRGTIAVKSGSRVYLSWRLLGTIEKSSNIVLAVRDSNGDYLPFDVDENCQTKAVCTGQSNNKGSLYPISIGSSGIGIALPINDGEECQYGTDENGNSYVINPDNITELQITIPANTSSTFYIDEVLPTGDPASIITKMAIR